MKKDRLLNEDCIKGMASCRRSVDLAFADPPFNIGYDYDVTTTPRDRRLPRLVAAVIEGVVRVLKPDGTFWLPSATVRGGAQGALHARAGAALPKLGDLFYTFGVHCKEQVHAQPRPPVSLRERPGPGSRSTRWTCGCRPPASWFTATSAPTRWPRADDTWMMAPAPADAATKDGFVLRPQDIPDASARQRRLVFLPRGGQFQRAAWLHGCQMPEQLLAASSGPVRRKASWCWTRSGGAARRWTWQEVNRHFLGSSCRRNMRRRSTSGGRRQAATRSPGRKIVLSAPGRARAQVERLKSTEPPASCLSLTP